MAERRPERTEPPGADARLFFDLSPVPMLELDPRGVVRAANPAALALWGEDVTGSSLTALCAGLDHAKLARLGSEPAGVSARVAAGERHLELVLRSAPGADAILAYALDAGALTAERGAAEQRGYSLYDELTGLPTRVLFLDRLGTALARGGDPGLTGVVVVGIDDFKVVNTSLGHQAGDEVLAITAQRLKGTVKGGDTVARLGGDEFGVILNGVDPSSALAALERLMSAFARPYDVAGRDIIVHASAGLEVAPSGASPAEVLHHADLAMRAAKDGGKSRFARFEPELAHRAERSLALRAELARAVRERRFVVLYQPIVALPSGRIAGAEALVRWHHDERGLIPPADFIPLAEASGEIVPIGLQVLELACRQTAEWLRAGTVPEDFYVSVNLSPHQLMEDELVSHVRAVLSASGLEARNLVLEITESALVGDVGVAIDRLAGLRSLGIRIAMDDFGTGYSSLSYLQRLPVDIVKIDRAFVSPITEGVEGAAVARAIVRLAGALSLETVAEGVETAEQADALAGLGCASAQGFLYFRPLEPHALAPLLGAEAPG